MAVADLLGDFDRALGTFDRVQLQAHVAALVRLQSAVEARLIGARRQLAELERAGEPVVPDAVMVGWGRMSRREAQRCERRVEALDLMPSFEPALASGRVTAAHVDALVSATHSLEADDRQRFAAQAPHLLAIAGTASPEEFARAARQTARRVHDDEGVSLLERQRRATFLRHWVDRDTGMLCLRGELDPESGLAFIGRLESKVEALFHAAVPDTCPAGDRRNDHLNALALLALVGERGRVSEGGSARPGPAPRSIGAAGSAEACGGDSGSESGGDDRGLHDLMPARAEICVTIDERTLRDGLHAGSRIDTGSDLELPLSTIRRLACEADIIPVVLDGSGVVLDIGRAKRLATRAQRRALRVMSRTCEMPGCHVAGRHCTPHHVRWWRNGGGSDLSNLVLLCSQHHHAVHEGGWMLDVCPKSRTLTATLPDGTVMANGPPSSRAG